MPELLAIPAWMTDPRPLDDWLQAFETLGHPLVVVREAADGVLLRAESLQLDGFAEIEESIVTAIDFEYPESTAIEPLAVLRTIAQTLGWELHESDGDED